MRDVFSNMRIKNSYDASSDCFGMISKIKTARHTSELQQKIVKYRRSARIRFKKNESKFDYYLRFPLFCFLKTRAL